MAAEAAGSISGSSSESRFTFQVQDPRLHRADYVKVHHEDGTVLAQVAGITRERDGLVGQASVIGNRDARGILATPKTPFRPGDKVWHADDRLIQDVLGLGEAASDGAQAYLGLLKGHGIRVNLDIDLLVQKHVSVMAKTGSGKSYVVGVLIEELLKRQVPVIIVDPHGEYTSLAHPNNAPSETSSMRRFGVKPRSFADRILEFSPDVKVNPDAQPLRLEGTNLGIHDLTDMLGSKASGATLGVLSQAIKDVAARRKKGYTFQDIIAEVNKSESNAKWNLLGALQYVEGLGIFDDQGTSIQALVKRGQITVINLRGSPPELQEIVVAWLSKELFEARKVNSVPPLMMVVEEAHHFCPERGFTQARSSDVLRTIASEGRKFGLGLCVVSQRPAKVDKNVLSQANTQIILKVTNPNDLKAIIASVEGLTRDAEDQIQALPVGTALVSHPRFPMPVQVEIRPRETRHGGKGVSVLDAWGEKPDAEAAEAGGEASEAKTGGSPAAAPSSRSAASPEIVDAIEAEAEERWEPEPADADFDDAPTRFSPRHAEVDAAPIRETSTTPPATPADAPAVVDLRAMYQNVLRESLSQASEANLSEALEIVESTAPTLRGLCAEFPGTAEIEELQRLHRLSVTRLRKEVDERRRGVGLFRRWAGRQR